MSDYRIAIAAAADADAVAELVHELAREAGETSRVDAAYVRRWLAFPGRVVLVAAVAAERVGFLAYSLNPNLWHAADCCLIEDLYVKPAWRGRGIGGALVARVVAEGSRAGWAEVSVSTGRDNRAALALYRRQGLDEEWVLLEKHFAGA